MDADICTLVPVASVAAAAGGIEPLSSEGDTTPPASCRYFFDFPDPFGPQNASATLQMLSDFELERLGAGDAAIDIVGLGDDAWARPHADSYGLYVQRDNLVFSVSVAGINDADRPGVARAIAVLVLATL